MQFSFLQFLYFFVVVAESSFLIHSEKRTEEPALASKLQIKVFLHQKGATDVALVFLFRAKNKESILGLALPNNHH